MYRRLLQKLVVGGRRDSSNEQTAKGVGHAKAPGGAAGGRPPPDDDDDDEAAASTAAPCCSGRREQRAAADPLKLAGPRSSSFCATEKEKAAVVARVVTAADGRRSDGCFPSMADAELLERHTAARPCPQRHRGSLDSGVSEATRARAAGLLAPRASSDTALPRADGCAPQPQPPQPQQQATVKRFLAEYSKGRMIGKGATGSVFIVTARATGAKYACKVMRLDALSESSPETARKELQMLLAMREHPSFVRLHDHFMNDRHCVLLMDLLEGGDLERYVRASPGGALGEREAKAVARCVLRGLAHLHATGAAHRDVKLENLMLARSGDPDSVKIVDLGLSKVLSSSKHTLCGSPLYIAPEALLRAMDSGADDGHVRSRYDEGVDVWACGIMLHILLSGREPYSKGNTGLASLLREIASCSIRLDSAEWQALVSPEALDLLKRMLAVDPSQRITAREALVHPWLA